MRVAEITMGDFSVFTGQLDKTNETGDGHRQVVHGLHPERGEIVLIRIGREAFVVESDEYGSPLGELLTQFEKI